MPDHIDTQLAEADRAAEALAKSQREPFSQDIDPVREAELDDAFNSLPKPPDGETPEAQILRESQHGRENGGVVQPIEGTPKAPAETPPADPAAAKAAADAKAAEDAAAAAPAEGKGLLEDLVAAPATKPADTPPADPYGDVKLRSDASPKTRETFEQLKTVAKQREEAAIARANEAQTKLQELQTKVGELEKRTVAPETEAELKELRAFRAQFDTANDPTFQQKFDSRLNQNYGTIYAKLQAHGLPAAEIEKLKTFSRADRDTAIDGFLSKLPSLDRKLIEAKLLDNINVSDERERALQEARTNADKLLEERKTAPALQTAQRDTKVAELLRPAIQKLPWLLTQDIPATAAPEEKKKIEAANVFATSMQNALKAAIVDDAPAARAEAAIAVPLAHYYRRQHSAEKARADALQAKLDGILAASSTSRLTRSAGPQGAPPKPAPTEHQEAGPALDDLFAQVTGRT